ncbi:hypothetical protein [Microbulbifer litoralis]|uniref:hypothetical protein n=1 Tax=Microbulbifer litoralis TaxID=2933965 RepID=UPI0020291438|nr:hypothetical protein [Microbulbifer sp. GX H0434]
MKIRQATLLLLLSFTSVACNSEADSKTPEDSLKTSYTRIGSCEETVDNANAAFSILDCGKVAGRDLRITVQSPTIFTVRLMKSGTEAMSEFEELSGDLPLETGPALEWYSDNQKPRFMVFRVSWGTDKKPFQMDERLVINYVAKDRICPLATVSIESNKNANEKTRELIYDRFLSTSECPEEVLHF